MDEDQPVEVKTPMMEENEVLKYFQDNFTTNPKKLKKMALRLLPQVSAFIKRGFITDVLTANNPAAYVRKCIVDMEEYQFIIKDLIERGDHGMIIVDDVIHGVHISAESNWLRPHDKWNDEEEIEIQHKLCRAWMAEKGLKRMHGKIVLFPAFGFSGMAREIGPDFKLEG